MKVINLIAKSEEAVFELPQEYEVDEELTFKVCVFFQKQRDDDWVISLMLRNDPRSILLSKFILKRMMKNGGISTILEKIKQLVQNGLDLNEILEFIIQNKYYRHTKTMA